MNIIDAPKKLSAAVIIIITPMKVAIDILAVTLVDFNTPEFLYIVGILRLFINTLDSPPAYDLVKLAS
jgi:hypothetical protein